MKNKVSKYISKKKNYFKNQTLHLRMDAEQAADKAISFIRRRGVTFVKLMGVQKRGTIWYVNVDMGTIYRDVRTVKINDAGKIIGMSR